MNQTHGLLKIET